jgi:hypothetical protein
MFMPYASMQVQEKNEKKSNNGWHSYYKSYTTKWHVRGLILMTEFSIQLLKPVNLYQLRNSRDFATGGPNMSTT